MKGIVCRKASESVKENVQMQQKIIIHGAWASR